MSRRERGGRERHRSGFDREPSPKRSRRDGRVETERVPTSISNNGDQRDQKHRRRLQDALPLETSTVLPPPPPLPPQSNVQPTGANNNDDPGMKQPDPDRSKLASDPTQVPRSRSYFQHDERGNAGQVRRSFGRRATDEREGRDSKDDRIERNKSETHDLQRRNERSQAKGGDNDVWHHDGFFKIEAEPAPPARKRPAFREKKMPEDSENTDKGATEPVKSGRSDYHMSGGEKREPRDHNYRHLDRMGRPAPKDRAATQRTGIPSRERYGTGGGSSGSYRGRDRSNGKQQGYRIGDAKEKWKHDLFDEATKSPVKKNEEDQIAMVEALLAS